MSKTKERYYEYYENTDDPIACYVLKYIEELEKMQWTDAINNPPKESGRYWCYISEQNDLGLSHYQWNCAYNLEDKEWSSNCLILRVTHWMELPEPPK